MTTKFSLLVGLCGLSLGEAATHLDVRPDTVKSWASGRRSAPEGAINNLVALWDCVDRAGDEAADWLDQRIDAVGQEPDVMEIGASVDDVDAQQVGWPTASVHQRVIALAIARVLTDRPGLNIVVVPRGSTVTTAAAAENTEKTTL